MTISRSTMRYQRDPALLVVVPVFPIPSNIVKVCTLLAALPPAFGILFGRHASSHKGEVPVGENPRKAVKECVEGSKKTLRTAVVAISALAATLFATGALARAAKPAEARNVVLVHGAWADGSSWAEVISRLQAASLHVTAVQNPLTTLADSVAATRRALALQTGPTVLVAHSWGGTVISETGIDPKVTALVYVAARAPDAGEAFVALSAKF